MRDTLAALRVLVVLPHPPLPEGSAAARCAIGLVRGLLLHGVEVQLLAANLGSAPLDTIPTDLPVEVVPIDVPSNWQARRDRILRPNGLLRQGRFADRLRELAESSDLVHFVEAQAAVAMGLVNRPSLVQIHFLTRRDRKLGWPWQRDTRTTIELLRAERSVCKRARWLLANSQEVASDLAQLAPHAHVVAAPLALDPSFYTPRASAEPPVAGLIGMARWPPTKHAVERLIGDVWPLVLERSPQARLMLAGKGMEQDAFSHLPEHAGVQWCGEVPSATGFLRELGVLLYPLTDGSGVKVKVLEALALGIPVVTTPDGAEGLGDKGGVTVETEDRALAMATVRLLDDGAARSAAADAAYRTFAVHHTPQSAAQPVVDLYERILAS
ncbi:MAG: glycosyltransferase family 4 protein [Solirubrobacteraceae bacterium]